MARTLRSDKLLFWATLLLVGASVVMVYSASAVQSTDDGQGGRTTCCCASSPGSALGLGVMVVAMRVDYHQLRRQEVIWTLVGVTALALVAVFFFPAKNDTNRWITFGSFSVQPAELAKLTAVIFAAALLERRMHRVNDVGYALAPIGLVTGALAGLMVLQPDFGTAAVVVLVVTTVVFAAGLSYRYLLGTLLVLLPTAMALIVTSPYRMRRLQAYLDPWADPLKDGYQVVQSLIAVGSGGVAGKGLMGGVQKLYYIPEAHNDFIFAVIAEEFGLIGTTLILLCFVIDRVARHPRVGARAGSLRLAARGGPDDDGRAAGADEPERRDRPAAEQGDSAAVRERRRVVAHREPGGDGDSAQHLAAVVVHGGGIAAGGGSGSSSGGDVERWRLRRRWRW